MIDVTNKLKNYFSKLEFKEDTHTYTVEGRRLPSVSGLIKKFVDEPDFKKIAGFTARKRKISVEEVQAEWDAIKNEACDRGNRVHLFGEDYAFDRSLKPSCKQEEAVVKFWNDLPEHIVPIIMELQMYHKDFHFAGTADILLYDKKNDSLILGDYKTNKDLFKNFRGKKLLAPFKNKFDCPYSKYEIQLSYYQILLEQAGFKVSGKKLVWLLPDGTYNMYETEDCRETLLKHLNNNKC